MSTARAQNPNRREESFTVRVSAATLARSRVHPTHLSNTDEASLRTASNTPSYLASFTKGLPHLPDTGLLADPRAYALFVKSIDSASERDFRDVPLGPPGGAPFASGIARSGTLFPAAELRAWESAGAGSTFDLQGPDAQAVTMPPAPELRSDELVAEMKELYWMALLRDVPFADFATSELVRAAVASLNDTAWICQRGDAHLLTDAERGRLRGPFTADNVFRGPARGNLVGPYVSQFLLAGTRGLDGAGEPRDGFVQYGATRIDQRVRVAEPRRDYMTTWAAWLDVQNGADVRGRETYVQEAPLHRFIATPRDLATYVHVDRLYQAYLSACVQLLEMRAPLDGGLPFLGPDAEDKQQGFATFGGPHILTLVGEVATRALKAMRFQKFNVHRRGRPEAVGGLVDRFAERADDETLAAVGTLYAGLGADLLGRVAEENRRQNGSLSDNGHERREETEGGYKGGESLLLPMAYAEGSPMHPSYGAGHAVVAAACTTMLKAFFEGGFELPGAFVASRDGSELVPVEGVRLIVEGELNKLCANMSIGRNWAGVHYYSDYVESVRMGEQVAVAVLEEQKLTFGENFSMTVPLFDGAVRRI